MADRHELIKYFVSKKKYAAISQNDFPTKFRDKETNKIIEIGKSEIKIGDYKYLLGELKIINNALYIKI